MNGLELKWVGEGGALRLSLSVPGVSALYPVADIIAALRANPEACAEVMRGLNIAFVESIERLRKVDVLDEVCQALGVSPLVGTKAPNMVRHLVIDRLAAEKRAESAERERDEARARLAEAVLAQQAECSRLQAEVTQLRAERDMPCAHRLEEERLQERVRALEEALRVVYRGWHERSDEGEASNWTMTDQAMAFARAALEGIEAE